MSSQSTMDAPTAPTQNDSYRTKPQVLITVESRLGDFGNDRFSGRIWYGMESHAWEATLRGYQLFNHRFGHPVRTPCEDVVIYRASDAVERLLREQLINAHQQQHDRDTGGFHDAERGS
jgi:hypothetical protein